MRHTLLILSHLLRYPSEAMQQAAPELVAALELDGVLESGQIEEVKPLVQALIDDDATSWAYRPTTPFQGGLAVAGFGLPHTGASAGRTIPASTGRLRPISIPSGATAGRRSSSSASGSKPIRCERFSTPRSLPRMN